MRPVLANNLIIFRIIAKENKTQKLVSASCQRFQGLTVRGYNRIINLGMHIVPTGGNPMCSKSDD